MSDGLEEFNSQSQVELSKQEQGATDMQDGNGETIEEYEGEESNDKRRRFHDEGGDSRRERSDRNQDSERDDSSAARKEKFEFEYHFLFDTNFAGALIGKSGSNFNRLKEEFKVFVALTKSGYPEIRDRVLTVRGSPEAVEKVIVSLLKLANEFQQGKEHYSSNYPEVRLLMHKTFLGAVIGKEGAQIKQTMSETGAKVRVSKDTMPGSTEKLITIEGEQKPIEDAFKRVMEQLTPVLQNQKNIKGSIVSYVPGPANLSSSRNPSYGAPYNGGAGSYRNNFFSSPHQQRSGYSTSLSSAGASSSYAPAVPHVTSFSFDNSVPLTEQKLAIPAQCAGCVIGKSGSKINELRARSGCNIIVEKEDPSSTGERIIVIRGNTHNINNAISLIRECIDNYRPKEPVGNGQA